MKKTEGEACCRIVKVARYDDERGSLCYVEGGHDFPFPIQRMFWIFNVPAGAERGGHAHWTCSEVIFPVSGSFEITVDDGIRQQTFVMDRPDRGIIIPAGVWCTLRRFSPGTVCCVAASHPYDADGYVNDYETYLKERRARQAD
jgi:hypothetical protein